MLVGLVDWQVSFVPAGIDLVWLVCEVFTLVVLVGDVMVVKYMKWAWSQVIQNTFYLKT